MFSKNGLVNLCLYHFIFLLSRLYVVFRCPTLKFLDSRIVSEEERKEAKRVGQFMKVVKPSQEVSVWWLKYNYSFYCIIIWVAKRTWSDNYNTGHLVINPIRIVWWFLLNSIKSVSYTHLRAHETGRNLVCRLLLEKKN